MLMKGLVSSLVITLIVQKVEGLTVLSLAHRGGLDRVAEYSISRVDVFLEAGA